MRNNVYAACSVADSRESCLVNAFNSVREQNAAARESIRNYANEGVIDQSAYGLAVFFSAIASFSNVLNLSNELAGSHSL